MQNYVVQFKQDHWVGRFNAMASPCEIFIELNEQSGKQATQLVAMAYHEAQRIDTKFSRYRHDNIIDQINTARGQPISVDEETANLINYAEQCYQLSHGKFDITSGVLRAVWRFDGSDNVPTQTQIDPLLPRIGWQKVTWERSTIILPAPMEIDLGGIGKEYAVDRTASLIATQIQATKTPASVLINYGGDIYVTQSRNNGQGWHVGIEQPSQALASQSPANCPVFSMPRGGLATSGDARRYLLKEGIRYSHILDPQTGWPIKNAPRSVTVVAATCTEAGMLASFAMLQGDQAESFLKQEQVNYWCEY